MWDIGGWLLDYISRDGNTTLQLIEVITVIAECEGLINLIAFLYSFK